ncbi:MAG TPA: WGR domain-containing protein [Polyangiaceae bacterium]
MTIKKSVELFFQEGTHDKLYHARIVETTPGKHDVEVSWGRRGASLNQGKKAVGVSLETAEKTYAKLVREKTGKGYQEISGAIQPAAVAPPEGEGSGSKVQGKRARVGRVAQLLNAVDEETLEKLLVDDAMIAQQKLDGVRMLVQVGETMIATNRAGQATTMGGDVIAGLSHLPHGTIVDGEVVAGTYYLFDVLAIGGEDLSKLGYAERWDRLDGDLEPGLTGSIEVLPYASGKDKRKLLESLRKSKAEGIVFKNKAAPYTPGRPASGGMQLKHKFIKSADVVVVENAGNAYRMIVHDARGKQVDVGRVFAGTTNASRKELDDLLAAGERPICEVKYLYATADDQLYQPVFVRLRDDKDEDGCLLAQLSHTNRDLVD